MIAADSKLLTYAEAGLRLGLKKQAVARRVKSGEIVATVLGYKSKFIAELDLLKYMERCRALEKVPRRFR